MKFATTASALLLAGSAVASPLGDRVARRRNGVSRPNQRQSTYESTNWSGAVLVSTEFTEVYGTVIAPTPSLPSGANDYTSYCASAWVGIDGDTCQNSLFQTGFDFCIQGGSVTYDAWYEWIPADSIDYGNFYISAGDEIEMSVVATSTTSGVATLTNKSTGQSVSHTFTSSEVTSTLCETNAEWIVEDFTEISSSGQESLAPFPAFDSVTFTNATALQGGSYITASGASTIDLISDQNQVITTASVSGDTITVTYQ